MKFAPLLPTGEVEPRDEYTQAREIGPVRVGEEHLFFRDRRKVYYIPYTQLERCFRRVLLIPAKMCCGRGDLAVEHLVLCAQGRELAQIRLPGERAGKMLLEEIARLAPGVLIGKPGQTAEDS